MPETYRKRFRGISLVSRRWFTASSRAKSPQPGHQAISIPFFHMSDHLQVMQLALDVCGAQGSSVVSQDLSLIHISEPTRLGMISYAVFCLKKKKKKKPKKK